MLIKFDFVTWGDENGAATTDMEAFFLGPDLNQNFDKFTEPYFTISLNITSSMTRALHKMCQIQTI